MVFGFCLLIEAGYQQYRGVTTAPPGLLVSEQLAGIVKSGEIVRQKDPDDFRVVMALRWFFGIVSAFAGIVIASTLENKIVWIRFRLISR
jgi:hypothetical protein